jgi:hypothetical protein
LAGSQWAYELGVVGEDEAGSLNLGVMYKPFVDLPADSTEPINCRGALFVTVRQCQELPSGDWGSKTGSADPYVLIKVGRVGLVGVAAKGTDTDSLQHISCLTALQQLEWSSYASAPVLSPSTTPGFNRLTTLSSITVAVTGQVS